MTAPATVRTESPVSAPRHHFTRYAWIPVGLAVAFEALAWLTGDIWLHVLAALSAAVLIAAFLENPRISGLTLEVEHPRSTTVGETSIHRFTVRNTGRRTTSTGHLRDHTHGLEDLSILLPRLAPGASTSIDVPRSGTARGVTPGHIVLVSSSAPYGLRLVTCAVQLRAAVIVRPSLVPVPVIRPVERELDEDSGRIQLRRDGPTVRGLREWRSGDDARAVHWRASARRGQLVVLEREAPRRPTLTLLAITGANPELWEHSVSVLASVALQGIRAGLEVSLFAAQDEHDSLMEPSIDAVLDGCAALAPAGWPSADLLERAASTAGPGGRIHVVAHGMDPSAWRELSARLAAYGVSVVDVANLRTPRR